MRTLNKHLGQLAEQISSLVIAHEREIREMIQGSESESVTIPVSLFISVAPGSQRVSAKMTLTRKEVFTSAIDIDPGQERMTGVEEAATKESKKAIQKANAAREKEEAQLRKAQEKADKLAAKEAAKAEKKKDSPK